MKIFRRSYDWVLGWSESKWGTLALFLLAVSESIFFPVPPDILLIALAIGKRRKALTYGLICLGGSVAGATIGYLLGHGLWWAGPDSFSGFAHFFYNNIPGFTIERFYLIKDWYDSYNFWIIFTAGFTPIPYKIFTLTAGAYDVAFPMFLIASVISRGARFLIIAGLIFRFGKPIKNFIDKYFNLLAVAFTVLLIGGFLLLKYIL